jgi:hypothetical protein
MLCPINLVSLGPQADSAILSFTRFYAPLADRGQEGCSGCSWGNDMMPRARY